MTVEALLGASWPTMMPWEKQSYSKMATTKEDGDDGKEHFCRLSQEIQRHASVLEDQKRPSAYRVKSRDMACQGPFMALTVVAWRARRLLGHPTKNVSCGCVDPTLATTECPSARTCGDFVVPRP